MLNPCTSFLLFSEYMLKFHNCVKDFWEIYLLGVVKGYFCCSFSLKWSEWNWYNITCYWSLGLTWKGRSFYYMFFHRKFPILSKQPWTVWLFLILWWLLFCLFLHTWVGVLDLVPAIRLNWFIFCFLLHWAILVVLVDRSLSLWSSHKINILYE